MTRRADARSRSRAAVGAAPARRWGRDRRSCSLHGLTATAALRRPRLAGAAARRASRRSPTTPAATASPIRRPRGAGYSYDGARRRPRQRCSTSQAGERPLRARRPLDGSAHARRATRSPTPSGSRRWSSIGPVSLGDPPTDGGARLLGRARRRPRAGRGRRLRRRLRPAASTRSGARRCCGSPATGLGLHRHPEAVAAGAARGAALDPVRRPRRARVPRRCRRSSSPATTRPTRATPTRSPRPGPSGCRARR